MKVLLEHGTYPALVAQDEKIINEALAFVRAKRIPPDRFELEMLLGIRSDLQKRVLREGFRLGLCVSYDAAWRAH